MKTTLELRLASGDAILARTSRSFKCGDVFVYNNQAFEVICRTSTFGWKVAYCRVTAKQLT